MLEQSRDHIFQGNAIELNRIYKESSILLYIFYNAICYVILYFLLLCPVSRHCTTALCHVCPISSQMAQTKPRKTAALTHIMISRVDLGDGIRALLMMMISEVSADLEQ